MADLTFNKIAGAVLATGFVIFGLQNAMSILFESSPPTKPGYAIAVQETTDEGAAPADTPPDWGTVLPAADVAAGQTITSKCQSCHVFDAAGTNAIGPASTALWAGRRAPMRATPTTRRCRISPRPTPPGPTTCSTSS